MFKNQMMAVMAALMIATLPVAAETQSQDYENNQAEKAVYTDSDGRTYVGWGWAASGDVWVRCDIGSDEEVNDGGACFDLDGTEEVARATIEADNGLMPGGYVEFLGEDGSIDAHQFCGASSPVLDIPPGATTVRVWVNGPAFAATDCFVVDAMSSGTITLETYP